MELHHLLLIYVLGILSLSHRNVYADCTFPSYMTGIWYDNRFLEVEFQSSSILYMKEYAVVGSGSTSNLTCYLNSGNRYILRTTETFQGHISGISGDYYFYICMDLTQITTYSFFYYSQSEIDNNGERGVAVQNTETPTASAVCTTTIATELLQVMVRKDYESSIPQQCAEPLLGNFKFTLVDYSDLGDTGNVTACATLKTANTSYGSGGSSTVKVAFSSSNYFGCVKTLQSGSTYYTIVYNFDDSHDTGFQHRFSCWAIAYNNTNVAVSQRARMCVEGQSATAMPNTDGISPAVVTPAALISLTPYLTCVPTSDDEGSNAAVIAAVVVILLLLIAAVVGGILFYKCYYRPKKEREARLLEEQKKPKSHLGMMKKALEAGVGGNINRNQNDNLDMVDMEDEGIEGSITGVNPDKFREYNNNLKLSSKFIGTSTPVTPSGIDADFTAPNSVPENGPTREKTKLISGFSANMQGATSNDTPRTTAEQNGHVPNIPSAPFTSKQTAGVANGNAINMGSSGNVPEQPVSTAHQNLASAGDAPTQLLNVSGGDSPKQQANAVQPKVAVPAVINQNASSSGINREKSFSIGKNETGNNAITSVGKREKSFAMDKNGTVNNSQTSQEKVNTVASVNPFVEGNPTVLQQNQQASAQDKREDKLRKSVSFATEKPNEKPVISALNSKDPPPGILSPPKEKATIPGAVESEPPPVITLPREPSNLMGPRDTTLPEIDLKKNSVGSASGKGSDMPDMTNF